MPDTRSATVVRNGMATLRVDALEDAMARLDSIALSLGGWTGNSSVTTGADQVKSAVLELKLPAARYDHALRRLASVGKVESVNTTAEDVGEELVDLQARIRNARRLEERLVALLARRAEKLDDALAVERELARVREEIERHEGRLRFLETRTAVSTLVVSLHEPYPLVGGRPGTSPIGEAFRQAWRNFVGLVAAAIASSGVLIPVAAVAGGVWLVIRRHRRLSPSPAREGA